MLTVLPDRLLLSWPLPGWGIERRWRPTRAPRQAGTAQGRKYYPALRIAPEAVPCKAKNSWLASRRDVYLAASFSPVPGQLMDRSQAQGSGLNLQHRLRIWRQQLAHGF